MKNHLKKVLKEKKMSQYKLAQISGVSKSAIYFLSTGERLDITISSASKICKALDVKFEDLFYDKK